MSLVVFCHVPKCSGTTVRYYAQAAYPASSFFWLNREQEETELFFARVARQPIEKLDDSFIGGHFSINDFINLFLRRLGTSALDIVFAACIRDPFDRYISHYEYHLRNPSSYAKSLEILALPSEKVCQVGIYNTMFGMANRNIYSYYLLPQDTSDAGQLLDLLEINQVKLYLSIVPSNSPDFLFLNMIHKSLEISGSNASNAQTTPRLRAMLDASLSQGLRLNAHKKDISYAEQYPNELCHKDTWFAADYNIIRSLQSKLIR